MSLNHKMMKKCLDHTILRDSAKLLGIHQKETFVFDNEDETSVLMDFALNDYRADTKNAVDRYREKYGWKNMKEKHIFDALSASYTSLFKIVSISRVDNMLVLDNLLKNEHTIKLTDIAFSTTMTHSDYLIFTRLLPFKDFTMTSGVSFIFPAHRENYLLQQYQKRSKKIKSDNEHVKRFITFYKLNKTHGIDVSYI